MAASPLRRQAINAATRRDSQRQDPCCEPARATRQRYAGPALPISRRYSSSWEAGRKTESQRCERSLSNVHTGAGATRHRGCGTSPGLDATQHRLRAGWNKSEKPQTAMRQAHDELTSHEFGVQLHTKGQKWALPRYPRYGRNSFVRASTASSSRARTSTWVNMCRPRPERLAWLTGFTGSAGLAVVLASTAAVFTDGRYVPATGRTDRSRAVATPAHHRGTAARLAGAACTGTRPHRL